MSNNNTFAIDIEVRFRDLDAMGHVNNSVFFTYFEEGRKILFRNIFGNNSSRFILAHACCDYIKPAALNDQLTLFMKVGKIGTKSFELQYELTDRNDTATVFAKGESIQVCFDYERNESIPVSDAFRNQLIEYQESLRKKIEKPVIRPLGEGVDILLPVIQQLINTE